MIYYTTYANLVCACGERATFTGLNVTDASERASEDGWHVCGQSAVCPRCVAKRTKRIKANPAAKANQ
jgi:hypothetical protein